VVFCVFFVNVFVGDEVDTVVYSIVVHVAVRDDGDDDDDDDYYDYDDDLK
jgi:hypothetical protein